MRQWGGEEKKKGKRKSKEGFICAAPANTLTYFLIKKEKDACKKNASIKKWGWKKKKKEKKKKSWATRRVSPRCFPLSVVTLAPAVEERETERRRRRRRKRNMIHHFTCQRGFTPPAHGKRNRWDFFITWNTWSFVTSHLFHHESLLLTYAWFSYNRWSEWWKRRK